MITARVWSPVDGVIETGEALVTMTAGDVTRLEDGRVVTILAPASGPFGGMTSSTFKFTWVSRTGNIDTSIRQFASFRLAGAYAAREEREDSGWRCLKIEREDDASS